MTSAVARPLDVIIVGARKAGTTGLLRTLGTQPKVTALSQQEATVFHDPAGSWKAWCASYLDPAPKPDTLFVGKRRLLERHAPDVDAASTVLGQDLPTWRG